MMKRKDKDEPKPGPSKSIKVTQPESETSPAATTTIESISDKELLSIFSILTLWDLQSVEQVNHRWRWLALSVYSNRKTLSLIQTPAYHQQLVDIARYWFFSDFQTLVPFEQECYRVGKKITKAKVQWFGQRFPKATQLTLYCVDHLKLGRLLELIKLYPNLERFILFSTRTQQQDYYHCEPLWKAILGLKSLTHLYLPFKVYDHDRAHLVTLLTRPEHKIQSIYYICHLLHTLYGTQGQQLTKVNDEFFNIGKMMRQCDFTGSKPSWEPSTRIGVYLPERPDSAGRSLEWWDRLRLELTMNLKNDQTRVTHLDMSMPPEGRFPTFLPILAQLTQLTSVRLEVDHPNARPRHHMFHPRLNLTNYLEKLTENVRLPTVHTLHLAQFQIDPSAGIFIYFPVIFPAVRILHFEDCSLVNLVTHKRISTRWLAESLVNFALLEHVWHNNRLVITLDRSKDGVREEIDRVTGIITVEMFRKRM